MIAVWRMRKRAYADSRSMTWARTAERYLAVFESARREPCIEAHGCAVDGRATFDAVARHSGDADEPFSVHVRRHRTAPACGPFGAGPIAWLLRR